MVKKERDARNDIKATLVKIITNENEDKEIKDVARKAIIAISKPQEILTLSLLDNKLAIQVYGEDTIKATKEKFKDAPQAEEATYKSSLKGSGLKGLKVESAINTMDATRRRFQSYLK